MEEQIRKPARPTDIQNMDWVPSLELPGSYSGSDFDSLSLWSSSSASKRSCRSVQAGSLNNIDETMSSMSTQNNEMLFRHRRHLDFVFRDIEADDVLKSDLVSNDEKSTLNASVFRTEIGVQVGERCFSSETFNQYYKEMMRLQEHCYKLDTQLSLANRGIEFLVDDAKCNYYTWIEKLSVFTKLYEFLKPSLDEPYCRFSQDQILIMTLTKLRLNSIGP
ncbi:uncharacterized protein LOC135708674 [Ochlerotatus camptorhynchus]|uniref:uncharacterized protein LOC135708674 n=1 Tax=Ochlerotatus camptorhynchus TaxID=644619 RepID=UPI0031D5ED62